MAIRQDNELLDGTYGTTSPIQPDNEITAERHRDIIESKANRLNFGDSPDDTTPEGAFVANTNKKLGNLLTQDKIHQAAQSNISFTVDGEGNIHNSALRYSDGNGEEQGETGVSLTFYDIDVPTQTTLNIQLPPNLYTVTTNALPTLVYDEQQLFIAGVPTPQMLGEYVVKYVAAIVSTDSTETQVLVYVSKKENQVVKQIAEFKTTDIKILLQDLNGIYVVTYSFSGTPVFPMTVPLVHGTIDDITTLNAGTQKFASINWDTGEVISTQLTASLNSNDKTITLNVSPVVSGKVLSLSGNSHTVLYGYDLTE